MKTKPIKHLLTGRVTGGNLLFSNSGDNAGVYLAPSSGSWTSMNDRNAKENFTAVNARAVLDKVASQPVSTWRHKGRSSAVRPIGPMAQAFHAACGLNGDDDKHNATGDTDGVALAAIQGLNEKVETRSQKSEDRFQKLEAENLELRQELEALKRAIGSLANSMNGGSR